MSVAKLFSVSTDGSFNLEGTSGTTAKYRWIKLPPIKEGYEMVPVKEMVKYLDLTSEDDPLRMNALVHMAGLILVKEKEHA